LIRASLYIERSTQEIFEKARHPECFWDRVEKFIYWGVSVCIEIIG
jgi:hypothetical protein